MLRVNSELFKQLKQQPELIQDLMDEFYAMPVDTNTERTYADSRDVFRKSLIIVPGVLDTLYVDEFSTSLLENFREASSAFFVALAGWDTAPILEEVRYG